MTFLNEAQSDDPASASALPPKIEEALRAAGVRPTPHARQLLRAAAQLGTFKVSDRDVLSASGLLFAAIALDDFNSEEAEPFSDPEKVALNTVRKAFLGADLERESEYRSLITSDFYKEMPLGWRDAPPMPDTHFSDAMNTRVEELQNRGTVDVIDLLAASLVSPSEFLQRRLKRLQIDEVKLGEDLLKLRVKVSSFRARYRRERAGPLALGASQYAIALARLFRVAEAEFSLALLAPWGMGKTTIAREVQRYLVSRQDYSEDFKNTFGAEVEPAENLARYETITFSAWAYRRQPELWIWLYESFVKAFLDRNPIIKGLRIFRCGIAKHGLMPLLNSMAIMAFLAIPLAWIAAVIKGGLALFGALGLLTIIVLGKRWFKPVQALIDRYGVIASHRERLGLQALVGDDLRALVDSWVRGGSPNWSHILGFAGFAVLVAGAWAFFMPITEPLSSQFVTVLCRSYQDWCNDTAIASTISSNWYAWLTWVAISALVLLALIVPLGRVDRILLIVDDLDRCPPDEIVDLIDGIKLMLEEKKVGEHVQALVLADNRVLEQAIRKRFKEIVDSTGDVREAKLRRVVREHMEKVFLCHFHLPSLTKANVFQLGELFAQEFEPSDRARTTDRPPAPDPPEPLPDPSPPTPTPQPRPQPRVRTELPVLDVNLTFTATEKQTIARAIERHFGSKLGDEAPTPRFIRSFLFKYQLARMILQMKRLSYTPEEIADGLGRMLELPNIVTSGKDSEDELSSVLRQVA
jgi:KAP family P-loop domain